MTPFVSFLIQMGEVMKKVENEFLTAFFFFLMACEAYWLGTLASTEITATHRHSA